MSSFSRGLRLSSAALTLDGHLAGGGDIAVDVLAEGGSSPPGETNERQRFGQGVVRRGQLVEGGELCDEALERLDLRIANQERRRGRRRHRRLDVNDPHRRKSRRIDAAEASRNN